MKLVLFLGSRSWSNVAAIRKELQRFDKNEVVILHGGCRGADMLSDAHAKEMGFHTARVDALWTVLGNSAGPIRNGVMVSLSPSEAVAFHSDIENSRGSKDCLTRLMKAGIPFKLIER